MVMTSSQNFFNDSETGGHANVVHQQSIDNPQGFFGRQLVEVIPLLQCWPPILLSTPDG